MRADGQKMLLAIKGIGGEGEAAWRALLDDLVRRDCERRSWSLSTARRASKRRWRRYGPTWLSNAAPCTDIAISSPMPLSACTRKFERLPRHDLRRDARRGRGPRKAFVRKWRLKCRAVADSLEETGDKLFTFTSFPPSQSKSIRTSNAIERLHEEFKRRIKTQTVLPCAETAAMLFWRCSPQDRSPCARSTDGRPRRETRRSDH